MDKFEEKKELMKNELEDLDTLKPEDLPKILSKHTPQYVVRNEEDFYKKARIICENSFNLEESMLELITI